MGTGVTLYIDCMFFYLNTQVQVQARKGSETLQDAPFTTVEALSEGLFVDRAPLARSCSPDVNKL